MPRRAEVIALFNQLPAATLVSHLEMVHFVERHRLMSRGLGWIDLHLLASALVSRAMLATRDRPLARAARDLGIAA
jgi:rRNA-processing protein FCF1